MSEEAAPLGLEGLHDPAALPEPTPATRPYWEAAARGELVFQRCAAGHAFLYPRPRCPVCLSSDLGWERATGDGEVVTFACVHRPPWNDLPRSRPYVIALVRLDEGPQLMSTVEGIAPTEVAIGMRVRAVFERVREDLGLVRFAPVTGSGPR